MGEEIDAKKFATLVKEVEKEMNRFVKKFKCKTHRITSLQNGQPSVEEISEISAEFIDQWTVWRDDYDD